MIRAFVELIPGPGGEVRLTSAEMAHVKGARRARGRVEIELLDGRGGVACAELDASTGNATVVARCRRDAPPSVLLAVAIARGSRFDFLVEKCTELAVTELAPIRFERSQAGRGEGRDERWGRVARSAAKQSGSPYLPEIHPVRTLDGFLELWGERALSAPGLLLALDPDGQTRPISDVVRGRGAGAQGTVGLLIGPEGGLTDRERNRVDELGAQRVALDTPILRVETAAIVGISLVLHGLGRA